MCGIFGFVAHPSSGLDRINSRRLLIDLFHLSEPRGRDASGLVTVSNGQASVYKRPLPPDRLLSEKGFKQFLNEHLLLSSDKKTGRLNLPFSAIGHCRLVLSGSEVIHKNNQPIIVGPIVGIHNGLITNEDVIQKKFNLIKRSQSIDSEIIFQLINKYYNEKPSLPDAIIKCFDEIEGTASIAFFREKSKHLVLATNYGSLFHTECNGLIIFASERATLETLLKNNNYLPNNFSLVTGIQPNSGRFINLETANYNNFKLSPASLEKHALSEKSIIEIKTVKDCSLNKKSSQKCIKCILPKTYPFIDFDEEGICSACKSAEFKKNDIDWAGRKKLFFEEIEKTKNIGNPNYDCIVPVSGGKDSTYQAYFMKEVCGLNPLCVCFETTMMTELGRKNLDNISKLGVDLIFFKKNYEVYKKLVVEGFNKVGDEMWINHIAIYTYPVHIAIK